LVDDAALRAILERYQRRQGRRDLAAIVRTSMPGERRTRSELEDEFIAVCVARDFPLPETNQAIEVRGELFEVDCVWAEARLIVELDGRDAHQRALAFEEDRRRDRLLIAAGWTPMRITWNQLHYAADALERDLRDAYARGHGDARRFDHRAGA
jgi:very-short-patch-repair endonuclease